MIASPATDKFFADVVFPDDPFLPQLGRLLDSEWVCQAIQDQLPEAHGEPVRIRIHHFIHSIGKRALVSYEVSWPKERYLPPEYFVAKTKSGDSVELARYPQDQRLPGLAYAAQPAGALDLVNTHVLTMPARRARVQLIRYRPEYRAVLRHIMGRVRLYARVMRPADVNGFLATHGVATEAGFVVPGLAGYWQDGGVVWLTEVRGKDLRRRIRKGKMPAPILLLDGLESLWKAPHRDCGIRPFSLSRAYYRALNSFRHNARDHVELSYRLNTIADALDSFITSWRPSGMAHNDFYDDQLLVLPDGRIALVDLEDIAPGDPLLDVGNFLAHLRWSAASSRRDRADNCRAFHADLRGAALDRFGWDGHSLALREAACLFRICTNVIRHPKRDWQSKLEAGLLLVHDCLE